MSMSFRAAMSTAVAFGCSLALHAQTPTSAQSNRAIPGEITITGCVERADQVAAATTAASTVDSLTFMLIHAQKGTAADPQPAGTSGTKEDAKGSSYRLEGELSTLNPHVGHKVEVTGTLEAATAQTSESVEPASPLNAPRLKVDHVKLVSETCAR
jgi:hypothetical protein